MCWPPHCLGHGCPPPLGGPGWVPRVHMGPGFEEEVVKVDSRSEARPCAFSPLERAGGFCCELRELPPPRV